MNAGRETAEQALGQAARNPSSSAAPVRPDVGPSATYRIRLVCLQVTQLLNSYLAGYSIAPHMSEEEVAHWLAFQVGAAVGGGATGGRTLRRGQWWGVGALRHGEGAHAPCAQLRACPCRAAPVLALALKRPGPVPRSRRPLPACLPARPPPGPACRPT